MKIILDNGHGSDTPGKRSPIWNDKSQLFEYEFNRSIVSKLYDRLKESGYDPFILVPETNDISLPDRVKRANDIYKKDKTSFLVSVHANAGGGTGWEIFTSVGQTESDILATFIFAEAHKLMSKIRMRREDLDGDPDKEENFYILKNTNCPAVLTENLFMDTESDCRFIMSPEGRQTIVDIHYNGIVRYINSKK